MLTKTNDPATMAKVNHAGLSRYLYWRGTRPDDIPDITQEFYHLILTDGRILSRGDKMDPYHWNNFIRRVLWITAIKFRIGRDRIQLDPDKPLRASWPSAGDFDPTASDSTSVIDAMVDVRNWTGWCTSQIGTVQTSIGGRYDKHAIRHRPAIQGPRNALKYSFKLLQDRHRTGSPLYKSFKRYALKYRQIQERAEVSR